MEHFCVPTELAFVPTEHIFVRGTSYRRYDVPGKSQRRYKVESTVRTEIKRFFQEPLSRTGRLENPVAKNPMGIIPIPSRRAGVPARGL